MKYINIITYNTIRFSKLCNKTIFQNIFYNNIFIPLTLHYRDKFDVFSNVWPDEATGEISYGDNVTWLGRQKAFQPWAPMN